MPVRSHYLQKQRQGVNFVSDRVAKCIWKVVKFLGHTGHFAVNKVIDQLFPVLRDGGKRLFFPAHLPAFQAENFPGKILKFSACFALNCVISKQR